MHAYSAIDKLGLGSTLNVVPSIIQEGWQVLSPTHKDLEIILSKD